MLQRKWLSVLFLGCLLGACKKKEEATSSQKSTAAETSTNTKAGGSNSSSDFLVSGTPALPTGMKASLFMSSAGKVNIPSGSDWEWLDQKENTPVYEIENKKLDIKVSLQVQEDVSTDGMEEEQKKAAIADFTKQFVEISHRDAPKYKLLDKKFGKVGMYPAARVDGQYETSKAYFSRDYLIFAKNKVLSVQVRGPATPETSVEQTKAISDSVAASLQ